MEVTELTDLIHGEQVVQDALQFIFLHPTVLEKKEGEREREI